MFEQATRSLKARRTRAEDTQLVLAICRGSNVRPTDSRAPATPRERTPNDQRCRPLWIGRGEEEAHRRSLREPVQRRAR
jgi:hypothetical protein